MACPWGGEQFVRRWSRRRWVHLRGGIGIRARPGAGRAGLGIFLQRERGKRAVEIRELRGRRIRQQGRGMTALRCAVRRFGPCGWRQGRDRTRFIAAGRRQRLWSQKRSIWDGRQVSRRYTKALTVEDVLAAGGSMRGRPGLPGLGDDGLACCSWSGGGEAGKAVHTQCPSTRYSTSTQRRLLTRSWSGTDVVSHGGDLDLGPAAGALDLGQDARQVHAGHHGELPTFVLSLSLSLSWSPHNGWDGGRRDGEPSHNQPAVNTVNSLPTMHPSGSGTANQCLIRRDRGWQVVERARGLGGGGEEIRSGTTIAKGTARAVRRGERSCRWSSPCGDGDATAATQMKRSVSAESRRGQTAVPRGRGTPEAARQVDWTRQDGAAAGRAICWAAMAVRRPRRWWWCLGGLEMDNGCPSRPRQTQEETHSMLSQRDAAASVGIHDPSRSLP